MLKPSPEIQYSRLESSTKNVSLSLCCQTALCCQSWALFKSGPGCVHSWLWSNWFGKEWTDLKQNKLTINHTNANMIWIYKALLLTQRPPGLEPVMSNRVEFIRGHCGPSVMLWTPVHCCSQLYFKLLCLKSFPVFILFSSFVGILYWHLHPRAPRGPWAHWGPKTPHCPAGTSFCHCCHCLCLKRKIVLLHWSVPLPL